MEKNSIFLYVLIILIFFAALFIRLQPSAYEPVIGIDAHYHVRMAETLLQTGSFSDSLSFGGRNYIYPPGLHITLASLSFLTSLPVETVGKFFITFIASLVVIPVFLIGKTLWGKKEGLITALLLVFIPVHIWKTSSNILVDAIAILLLSISFYFLIQKKWKYYFALSFFTMLFSPFVGLFSILLSVPNIDKRIIRRNTKFLIPIAVISFILFCLFSFIIIDVYSGLNSDISSALYEDIDIFEFLFRINPIVFVFGIVGIIMSLRHASKNNKSTKNLLFWIIVIVASMLFLETDRWLFYLSVPLSLFAGFSLIRLSKSKIILALFVILIILSGSFLSYHALEKLEWGVISENKLEAFEWIRDNTEKNSVILSSIVEGHWITNLAKRKNIIDGNLIARNDVNERYQDVKDFFSGIRQKEVIKKYNISYVFSSSEFNNITNFEIVFENNSTLVLKTFATPQE